MNKIISIFPLTITPFLDSPDAHNIVEVSKSFHHCRKLLKKLPKSILCLSCKKYYGIPSNCFMCSTCFQSQTDRFLKEEKEKYRPRKPIHLSDERKKRLFFKSLCIEQTFSDDEFNSQLDTYREIIDNIVNKFINNNDTDQNKMSSEFIFSFKTSKLWKLKQIPLVFQIIYNCLNQYNLLSMNIREDDKCLNNYWARKLFALVGDPWLSDGNEAYDPTTSWINFDQNDNCTIVGEMSDQESFIWTIPIEHLKKGINAIYVLCTRFSNDNIDRDVLYKKIFKTC
ncbi:MAG: hypothetical protein Hyperionvirus3_102 [Hyperionvirus sp.]|uniref:Uncharacterized protein n=1 Tax=Hyperionvirus sp. TaxID=2487770 RepID=A0A3G5A6S4_9VIRU|nr:MAG: hypothetical protein Hyperionvirus3_102 [Hyperionvirus sp.]